MADEQQANGKGPFKWIADSLHMYVSRERSQMTECFHVAFINVTVFLMIIIIIIIIIIIVIIIIIMIIIMIMMMMMTMMIIIIIPIGLGAQLATIGIQLSVELHVVQCTDDCLTRNG